MRERQVVSIKTQLLSYYANKRHQRAGGRMTQDRGWPKGRLRVSSPVGVKRGTRSQSIGGLEERVTAMFSSPWGRKRRGRPDDRRAVFLSPWGQKRSGGVAPRGALSLSQPPPGGGTARLVGEAPVIEVKSSRKAHTRIRLEGCGFSPFDGLPHLVYCRGSACHRLIRV